MSGYECERFRVYCTYLAHSKRQILTRPFTQKSTIVQQKCVISPSTSPTVANDQSFIKNRHWSLKRWPRDFLNFFEQTASSSISNKNLIENLNFSRFYYSFCSLVRGSLVTLKHFCLSATFGWFFAWRLIDRRSIFFNEIPTLFQFYMKI